MESQKYPTIQSRIFLLRKTRTFGNMLMEDEFQEDSVALKLIEKMV